MVVGIEVFQHASAETVILMSISFRAAFALLMEHFNSELENAAEIYASVPPDGTDIGSGNAIGADEDTAENTAPLNRKLRN
jgi:hypothetical protein